MSRDVRRTAHNPETTGGLDDEPEGGRHTHAPDPRHQRAISLGGERSLTGSHGHLAPQVGLLEAPGSRPSGGRASGLGWRTVRAQADQSHLAGVA
jgi:hypothetical protein